MNTGCSRGESADVSSEPVLHATPGIVGRGGVVPVPGIVEERVIGAGFGDEFVEQQAKLPTPQPPVADWLT